jgi:nucleoside-diphosphate-sugar epimerase
MIVGPGRQGSHLFGDWSGVIERPALGHPYTVHSDPDSPCAYNYVKEVARTLVELRRADDARLRQRMYNIHGFSATLREVAKAVGRQIPGAQIAFDRDQSEAMQVANRSLSYQMDTTAASEDFGYAVHYPLDAMVADFIAEVRAGRAG